MGRTALITGISGQDGTYLAEFLHGKGYHVFGMVRSESAPGAECVRELVPFVELVEGDLLDLPSLIRILEVTRPTEIYNLGALSSVFRSWSQPELTAQTSGLGALRMLEAIRLVGALQSVRFYQASSSEMFGRSLPPQKEATPFSPVHPYAIAKVFAHHATVNFREAHGLFAVCGILFNHESPRRSEEFVTRKITKGVARIVLGVQGELVLGNLDARRDWGYAPEYMEAMWLMMQRPEPDEFVIATGVSHAIRDFLAAAFREVGIEDWRRFIRQDPSLLRPADIHEFRGDASKARRVLGWEPRTGFRELVRIMVAADLEREQAAAPPARRRSAR